MKRLAICLILLAGASPAYAQQHHQRQEASPQYNPYSNQWEMTYPGAQPTWNPYDNTWTLQHPGAQLQYNPYSNQWEYPH